MPTYVVTGCSSGLGLEIVKQLAARGEKIYATCRKKESSATGLDELSSVKGDVVIIEDIDVTQDDVGEKLKVAVTGTIDVLVHNAGGTGDNRELAGMAVMGDQTLDNVTSDRMLKAFQLNTLGPLRVQQALNEQIASPGGKICIISTGMGSIADNTSGGMYAYRTSKAAVNMLSKGMSVDLKEKGIAVVAVNPGLVSTNFGPGAEVMAKMGAMPVTQSVEGLIKVFDDLTIETTGKFMGVKKDGPPEEFAAGW